MLEQINQSLCRVINCLYWHVAVLWLRGYGQLGLDDVRYGEWSAVALNAADTNSAPSPHESEEPRSILQSRLSIHCCQEKNNFTTGRCCYFKSLSNYITLVGTGVCVVWVFVCVHPRHADWLGRLETRTRDGMKTSKYSQSSKKSWGATWHLRRDEKQGRLWRVLKTDLLMEKIKRIGAEGVEDRKLPVESIWNSSSCLCVVLWKLIQRYPCVWSQSRFSFFWSRSRLVSICDWPQHRVTARASAVSGLGVTLAASQPLRVWIGQASILGNCAETFWKQGWHKKVWKGPVSNVPSVFQRGAEVSAWF